MVNIIKKLFLKNCNLRTRNFIFYSLFFVIAFCSFPADSLARVSILIAPQRFDLSIFPGDSYTGQFKIENKSEVPLSISVRAIPFGAEEGTGQMRFEAVSPDCPSSWIELEKTEILLEPGKTRRLNFQVNVPWESEPGGYYFFVYFEPRFPSHYFTEEGPRVIPVVGVPFLVSTSALLIDPEEGKELEILDFSISKEERVKIVEEFFGTIARSASRGLASVGAVYAQVPEIQITENTPSSFIVSLKNNDIYHLKPLGNLSVYNLLGNKIGQAELKGQTILPGKSRNFEVILIKENESFITRFLNFISLGSYRAELNVRALSPVRGEIFPDGDSSFSFFAMRNFYYLTVLILMAMIIYFARRRIKLALRVLFKK